MSHQIRYLGICIVLITLFAANANALSDCMYPDLSGKWKMVQCTKTNLNTKEKYACAEESGQFLLFNSKHGFIEYRATSKDASVPWKEMQNAIGDTAPQKAKNGQFFMAYFLGGGNPHVSMYGIDGTEQKIDCYMNKSEIVPDHMLWHISITWPYFVSDDAENPTLRIQSFSIEKRFEKLP